VAKCLIVDDHPLTRGGTAHALAERDPGIVVCEAASLQEALALLEHDEAVSLVLLDLDLPDSKGIDTLRQISRWAEDRDRALQVVVLSGHNEAELVRQVVSECATGFILKASPKEIFQQAIALTLAGGVYIPREIVAEIADGHPAQLPVDLTKREKEVLALLIRGHPYKGIARELEKLDGRAVAPETVRKHIGNIAWKLGVSGNVKQGVMAEVAKRQWTFAEQ
jgi:DNA-binding NarL/FixJ family response regulator